MSVGTLFLSGSSMDVSEKSSVLLPAFFCALKKLALVVTISVTTSVTTKPYLNIPSIVGFT